MECIPCNYETKYSTHFRRHIASSRHKEICYDNAVCYKCLKSMGNKGACASHAAACQVVKCPTKWRISKDRKTEEETEAESDRLRSLYMTIRDLMNDKFTASDHNIILHQMDREEAELMDYMGSIESRIEEDMSDFDREQEEDLAEGNISKKRSYSLRMSKYFRFVLEILCRSTKNLVITHRDMSVDGSERLMLFKHEGALHSDAIIRQMALRSKYAVYIKDNGEPFPKFSEAYVELFNTLKSHAMGRKSQHNYAVARQRHRRIMGRI